MRDGTVIYREECFIIKVLLLKVHDYIILILVTGFNTVIKVANKVESCVVVITKEDPQVS